MSDTRDILRQRLNEYREFLDEPQRMIGKFPIEIFRRWYDQYNQIYNREQEKLTEIFNHIFNTLKGRHDDMIKEQIKQLNTQQNPVPRYLMSNKNFNTDNYLTCNQVEEFVDLIIDKFQIGR